MIPAELLERIPDDEERYLVKYGRLCMRMHPAVAAVEAADLITAEDAVAARELARLERQETTMRTGYVDTIGAEISDVRSKLRGKAFRCDDCGGEFRAVPALIEHVVGEHRRAPTRDERTPQRRSTAA